MEKAYCPHCETLLEFDAEVRWKNVDCPACGKEFMVDPTFDPPLAQLPTPEEARKDFDVKKFLGLQENHHKNCVLCQGRLIPIIESNNQGAGCIIIILGALLAPFFVGIPILIFGLWHGMKKEYFYQCQSCGNKVPRKKYEGLRPVQLATESVTPMTIAMLIIMIVCGIIIFYAK